MQKQAAQGGGLPKLPELPQGLLNNPPKNLPGLPGLGAGKLPGGLPGLGGGGFNPFGGKKK